MPDIDLDLSGTDLEQEQLDPYEEIKIARQSTKQWVTVRIELPQLEDIVGPCDLAGEVRDESANLKNSIQKYEQCISEVVEFISSNLERVYAFSIVENEVVLSEDFQNYEKSKKRADTVEQTLQDANSKVEIEIPSEGLSEELITELEDRYSVPTP